MLRLSSLYTTDISSATVTKLRDVTDASSSTDGAWATVGMHSRILIRIVMEPDGFGLRSGENWTTLAENGRLQGSHILATLGCALSKCSSELSESDLTGSSLLILGKDQINIGASALLVDDFTVLGKLCEGLSVHLRSIGELSKHFLKAACGATR